MTQRIRTICLYVTISVLLVGNVCASDKIVISAPPSIWVQVRGDQLSGPVIDLLEIIFSEMDIKVSFISLPWARALKRMKSGKLDMIPVIFYTDERAEFMEFTEPYTEVPTSIFVPQGKTFQFVSLASLVGKQGLIMRGDSISSEFESYKSNLNLIEIAGYDQMIRMIAANRVDYAVAAQYGFLVKAKKLKMEAEIEMLPKPIASRSLHFAFSKKSPYVKYLPKVNELLKQLKADGIIERMVHDTINKASER